MYTVCIGKLRHASWSFFHDVLQNLDNIKIKIDVKTKPYKDDTELPARQAVDMESARQAVNERLEKMFPERNEERERYSEICTTLTEDKSVGGILEKLRSIGNMTDHVIKEWKADDDLIVGIVPTYNGDGVLFEAILDEDVNKVYIHWDKNKLPSDLLIAASVLAQHLRDQRRQPSVIEYLVFHLAYYEISLGHQGDQTKARSLGTPGFRPDAQTYMSLTDPGEGHILGATRYNEWMLGGIVHCEHVERPGNLPRQKIESYRLPSLFDFARVRLHVGTRAPTTLYVGRLIKDSGVFDDDFLKVVNMTSGTVTAAFYQGAAECKLSMEGLTTAQAVKYMLAIRGQVQRKKRQVLSAAWNLNQVITDDYDKKTPDTLKQRMEIASRAIEITLLGGFDKCTWDGASDTYPSKCVMYQLTYEEALTLVHEAHMRGLLTYFSAGFKFDDIKHGVYTGVDGIGVGGAQVLRHMDRSTGMHGPYMHENIPIILGHRDEAEKSFRGRGSNLLARLDTMFYEGSITTEQNTLRKHLFSSLLSMQQQKVEELTEQLSDVVNMPDEGTEVYTGRAKRLFNAKEPLLKEYFASEDQWKQFVSNLKSLVAARGEDLLSEDYYSHPWLTARKKYREEQGAATKGIFRQASFQIYEAVEK